MPKTSRATTVHPMALREAEVVRVADLTSGMRRITLTGPKLRGLESSGFDDWVRLFFAYPGESDTVLPVLKDGRLTPPKGRRPLGRVYSVRRWDAERHELDIDFVTHGVGVATTWAQRAEPGDRIPLAGPNSSLGMPAADWLLVCGDDTALPAIGRLLDELPQDARAQVFIEIAEDEHRHDLRRLPGVQLTWLSRDGRAPGTAPLLLDAVAGADWWNGRPFAWIAGEQSTVRDVRRHLVEARGMPREDVEFTGYWKRATVVARADDSALPDPEKSTAAPQTFHDLAELIPPIAIRVAVELALGDLISRGVTTVPELAARTGCDERALGKLLRYLHALDLLDETPRSGYRLTEVGEMLTNDHWIDALSPTGVQGRQSLGILGLAHSIRTGQASYAAVTGQDFAAARAEQDYEDRLLERVAGFQPALAVPIATSDLLDGVEHLVIHSGGAGAQAREFTTVHPELRVTICALPAHADWLRRDLPESIPDEQQRARVEVVEQSIFEAAPAADAVFVIRATGSMPDADAALALRRSAQDLTANGRVLLIEDTFDSADTDEIDEHQAEADLVALTREGGGLRTEAELLAVIAAAGLERRTAHTVGWGMRVHELVRPDLTVRDSAPTRGSA